MENQFVDLFDQKKYGFNFFVAIGFFLGGVIGWFFILFRFSILYHEYQFIFDIGDFSRSVLTNLIFAFVFIGLCHVIKKDIVLPFAAGLADIILGILFRMTGLYGGAIFEFRPMLIDFLWTLFLAAGIILFFRIMGFKPFSFVFGFAAGALLIQLFLLVFYSIPLSMFWKILLLEMVRAFIAGFLFYLGMAIHLKKYRSQIERERAMAIQATPIAPAGEPGVSSAGITVSGRFRKVAVRPIMSRGRYRGQGMVQIDGQGIKLFGRHVFSLGARWGIAVAIFFGFLFTTMALTGGAAFFAPGIIPLYFLMEYGILKRENISIPFTALRGFAADPQRKLIAVEFEGSPLCTPAVLKTENWRDALRALRENAPQLDRKPIVVSD